MKYWTLAILAFFFINGFAQGQEAHTKIQFQPTLNSEHLELNKKFDIHNKEIIISSFKFYITDLGYYKDDTLVHLSNKKAYLIDVSDSSTLIITEELPNTFNAIKFKIGVDSLTNVSGVYDGDLDPMNGMYWTWQSGYVNFKLEGTSPSCPARKNKFQWHVGGYRHPYDTQRQVSLKVDSIDMIKVDIQLENILKTVDISKTYQVLSPGQSAMEIADEYAELFKTFEE